MNTINPNELDLTDASYLEETDPEFDENYARQDSGGMATNHNGVADKLLQNDKLYNILKGDWTRTYWNGNHNIKSTAGRADGKFYIKREQFNDQVIAADCAQYRKTAEEGWTDPLAAAAGILTTDGKIGHRWINLPKVIAISISDRFFGGMPWSTIKRDPVTKAQFYKVVEKEYNQYVTYPGGKLPIPISVTYPTESGHQKYFKGGI